jgi:predicted nucleic acid-binding Zn ribbon protein
VLRRAAPQTQLAAVQSVWVETVGERVATVARPTSERGGTLTVTCADPVWAEELELMQSQLLERLRGQLGEGAPQNLRFRVGDIGE